MEGRTFRVFVSSTFSDLKEERNALSRHVFPRLRALCESRGFKFQAVDLRWGVRDEAAAHQQALRICLDEIARCQELSPKPNFVVLLGDRYGWCPLPNAISVADMNALVAQMTREQEKLVLYPNDDASSAKRTGWYRRDDNALPAPEYVLQSRSGEKVAFEAYEAWEPVERDLREALAGAAKRAGLGERYRTSATEHEIVKGALEAVDAQDHVFGFLRSIRNLEDVKAALVGEHAKQARELIDTTPSGSSDARAGGKQRELHEKLARRIGTSNVWPYEASWNAGRLELGDVLHDLPEDATPSLQADDAASMGAAWKEHSQVIAAAAETPLRATSSLCEAVWQRLSRVIALQMDALEKRQGDRLEVEQRAHAKFARDRARGFLGRKGPLDRIASYLSGGPARPLVVHGPSGCGKSALLARAIELARVEHPDAVIITRFVGAAPGASEARPLLHSLCLELTRAYGGAEGEVPEDYDKLVIDFPARLELARSSERPAFLFIDALDQLSDSNDGRKLWWLPHTLPPNVRVVVSTLPEPEYHCFPVLEGRAEAGDLVGVEKMLPEEGAAVLQSWLASAQPPRQLTSDQPAAVLEAFEREGLPLHLKLAFEEARRWHSYDGLPERVDDGVPKRGLPSDVPGLIRTMFDRLSGEHGLAVVSRSLGFLAAARHGLSDDEMLELLWRDEDVKGEFDRGKHHELPEGGDALPAIVWSRLYFDLEPYLAHREVFGVGLLGFYHRQLGEVAEARYLIADGQKPEVHGQLADYFGERWARPDTHALLELVPQLAQAGCGDEAKALILRYSWLHKKLAQVGVQEILGDFRLLQPSPLHAIGRMCRCLQLASHILETKPHELLSQLCARLPESDFAPIDREDALRENSLFRGAKWGATGGDALLPVRPSLATTDDTLLRTVLTGDDQAIRWLGMARDGTVLLSAAGDRLAVWAVSAEALSSPKVTRTLPCSPQPTSLSLDGKLVVAQSEDRAHLGLWQADSGRLLRTLLGHVGAADAVAFSPDGSLVVAGASDKIFVWSADTGTLLFELERHTRSAGQPIATSADNRFVAWGSADGTIFVWNPAARQLVHRLRAHTRGIEALAFAEHRALLLSASADRDLKLWDAETGALLRSFHGGFVESEAAHLGSVSTVAFIDEATILSFASQESIKLWDISSGGLLREIKRTESQTCAVAPGASVAVTSVGGGLSGPAGLRFWNLAAAPRASESSPRLSSTPGTVRALAMSSDGGLALAGTLHGKVVLFREDSGTLVGEAKEYHRSNSAHIGQVNCVVMNVDARVAASGGDDYTVRLWQLGAEFIGPVTTLRGHDDHVRCLRISDDARWVLSGDDAGTVITWDLERHRHLAMRDLHMPFASGANRRIDGLSFWDDNRVLLSSSKIGGVVAWDGSSGRSIGRQLNAQVFGRALLEGEPAMVILHGDRTVGIWATPFWEEAFPIELEPFGEAVIAIETQTDVVIGLGRNGAVGTWSLDTGMLRPLTTGVRAIAAAASKSLLATVSANELGLWELGSGTRLATFSGDVGFEQVAISSDGAHIVIGDRAGGLHFLRLPQSFP